MQWASIFETVTISRLKGYMISAISIFETIGLCLVMVRTAPSFHLALLRRQKLPGKAASCSRWSMVRYCRRHDGGKGGAAVAAVVVARLSNIAWYHRTPLCVATSQPTYDCFLLRTLHIHSALHSGRFALRNIFRIFRNCWNMNFEAGILST